jgi:DNA-binding transcriptional LysR family regulator
MDYLFSIKAFVTVGTLGSFTRASDVLNVSRGSLSRAVADLEGRLNTLLLRRTTRHVELAESARDYFETCSRVLEELDASEQRLRMDRDQFAGTLHIAVHPLVLSLGFDMLLGNFREHFPEISVDLKTQSSNINLALDSYDVAIYPKHLIANQNSIYKPLLESQWILVAAPAYLTGHPALGSAPDTLIVTGGREVEREVRFSNDSGIHAFAPSNRLCVSPDTARSLAISGVGVVMLPEGLVARDIESGLLVRVSTSASPASAPLELGAHYMHREFMPRRVRAFIDESQKFYTNINEELGRIPGSISHMQSSEARDDFLASSEVTCIGRTATD